MFLGALALAGTQVPGWALPHATRYGSVVTVRVPSTVAAMIMDAEVTMSQVLFRDIYGNRQFFPINREKFPILS